jgi:hypothetical protein
MNWVVVAVIAYIISIPIAVITTKDRTRSQRIDIINKTNMMIMLWPLVGTVIISIGALAVCVYLLTLVLSVPHRFFIALTTMHKPLEPDDIQRKEND